MCGRASLTASGEEIAEVFGLGSVPSLRPRYNMAPGQDVAAVRLDGGARRLAALRWGLRPRGGLPPEAEGRPMINARAESAARKAPFRESFRQRRCLVPVTGFYEWRRRARGAEPWLVRRRDGQLFALGALWDAAAPDAGADPPPETCAILTTEANVLVAPLHDRMPVLVPVDAFSLWLDPGLRDLHALDPLLRPALPDEMEAYPVSELVNRVEVDDPRCLEPAPEDRQKSLF